MASSLKKTRNRNLTIEREMGIGRVRTNSSNFKINLIGSSSIGNGELVSRTDILKRSNQKG